MALLRWERAEGTRVCTPRRSGSGQSRGRRPCGVRGPRGEVHCPRTSKRMSRWTQERAERGVGWEDADGSPGSAPR